MKTCFDQMEFIMLTRYAMQLLYLKNTGEIQSKIQKVKHATYFILFQMDRVCITTCQTTKYHRL